MGNPIQIPTGTAPRSSTTGMAEIVANTAHFGNPNLMNQLAIFCPVCKCSVVVATTAALPAALAALAGVLGNKKVKVTSAQAAP